MKDKDKLKVDADKLYGIYTLLLIAVYIIAVYIFKIEATLLMFGMFISWAIASVMFWGLVIKKYWK